MRFSLRTFLIIVAAVSLAIGLTLRPVLQRGSHYQRIVAAGGEVHEFVPGEGRYWQFMSRYFPDTSIDQPAHVDIVASNATDRDLAILANCKEIQTLCLDSSNVGDRLIKHIATLPKLANLALENTLVTDKSLEYLEQLPALQSLQLAATNTSDQRVISFAKKKKIPKHLISCSPALPDEERNTLRQLEQVGHDVFFESRSDASLSRYRTGTKEWPGVHKACEYSIWVYGRGEPSGQRVLPLTKLKQLEEVDFRGTFSAEACDILSQLTTLRDICLYEAKFNNLNWIGNSTNVETLRCYAIETEEHEWSFLANLLKLQNLDISSCIFRDQDLAHIRAGQPLQKLAIVGVNVTEKSAPLIASFQQLVKFRLNGKMDRKSHEMLYERLPKDIEFWIKGFEPLVKDKPDTRLSE